MNLSKIIFASVGLILTLLLLLFVCITVLFKITFLDLVIFAGIFSVLLWGSWGAFYLVRERAARKFEKEEP